MKKRITLERIKRMYRVVGIRCAITFDVSNHEKEMTEAVRCGDYITEKQAKELLEDRDFEVIVRAGK